MTDSFYSRFLSSAIVHRLLTFSLIAALSACSMDDSTDPQQEEDARTSSSALDARTAIPVAAPDPPAAEEWPSECVDNDGDGYPVCASVVSWAQDCDDRDPTRSPGGVEACDGVDNNCDGVIDERWANCPTSEDPVESGGEPPIPAPDPDNLPIPLPHTPPPAPEEWPSDCVDNDNDGYPVCRSDVTWAQDCDDDDAERSPGGVEACDGVDNNCDGVIDERWANCPTSEDPVESGGEPPIPAPDPDNLPIPLPHTPPPPNEEWPDDCVDNDGDRYPVCTTDVDWAQDCNDDDYEQNPDGMELCDGVDNDCDGVVDERWANCPTSEDPINP